ncbi:MAG: NAD(P)H-dependent oxidoreductase [Deltaproteobacteria bacterium]|nr:NAD(P)H-dependent oxidoreductase [Deltaproteobacteria bacterium]
MTVFVLSSSLRKESWNTKLAKAAAAELRSRGADARAATLADYAMPLYDQDIQDRDGIPKGARDLADRFRDADAFVVVSPEYNHSISGVLKNAVDWISRLRPVPWLDKPALLMSATPAPAAAARAFIKRAFPLRPPAPWCSRACSACPTRSGRSAATDRWPTKRLRSASARPSTIFFT